MSQRAVPADYAVQFHRPKPLEHAHPALVLIDLQRASASRHHGLGAALQRQGRASEGAWRFDRIEELVLPNVQRLLASARARHHPVFHVALGSRSVAFDDVPPYLRPIVEASDNRVGAPAHAFLELVRPQAGEMVITKATADAFIDTPFDRELHRAGVDTLIVAGVSTNSCVESTVRHAADLGYAVVLAEDACAAASAGLHEAAVRNLARFFVDVASTSDILRTITS